MNHEGRGKCSSGSQRGRCSGIFLQEAELGERAGGTDAFRFLEGCTFKVSFEWSRAVSKGITRIHALEAYQNGFHCRFSKYFSHPLMPPGGGNSWAMQVWDIR